MKKLIYVLSACIVSIIFVLLFTMGTEKINLVADRVQLGTADDRVQLGTADFKNEHQGQINDRVQLGTAD